MAIPSPQNLVFSRSNDSLFENVYIWGNLYLEKLTGNIKITGDLEVTGSSIFRQDADFKKDVDISGTLDSDFIIARTKLDVGVGGTVVTVDARGQSDQGNDTTPGRVGIFTSNPQTAFQINAPEADDDSGLVVTGLGTVGIGTTNPSAFDNDGDVELDIYGSISIQGEIYDARNQRGGIGNFLSKDEEGISWVSFEPSFSEGIFLMDEGVYVPIPGQGGVVGSGQSFTILNFVQSNSLGLGTDTLIPTARDPENYTGLATIFTKDLWGYSGSGDSAAIYRMTQVGINNASPSYDLDITGTLHATSTVQFDDTLTVASATTLNNTLTVANNTDLNGELDVANATTLNDTLTVANDTDLDGALDVANATTLNNTLTVTSATQLNDTLTVTNATALDSTLDVDGVVTFNNTNDATSSSTGSVQIDGGVGIARKLFVADITTIETTQESGSPTSGALVVGGGVGVGARLNVGGNVDFDSNLNVDGTSVFQSSVELNSSLIDVNNETGTDGRDYRLSSVGSGVSWRPSGVETLNTIWVTKSGNDSNSGLLEGDAKLTIGAAAAVAQEGDTIVVRPGVYEENNPIGIRTDVSVTGQDLRLVTVVPQNPTMDVFHVRRGCLIENLNFAGSSISVGHTGAGAVAFAPADSSKQANTGFIELGPITEGSSQRWRSPYVRNCTNFMTESIGMRIDGADATASIPGADLKSMVCDSFTQYNENGIGVSLTNNAYAQLVSIFTINCDIAIYADTGGQCDLTNSNSSFGNFGLVAVGLGSTQYQGTVQTGVIPGDNSDVVIGTGVTDLDNNYRRPFDGQALYFQIDLSNYADVPVAERANGRITAPLQEVTSVRILDGGSGFSQVDPPDVIIRDSDGTLQPKGPQGIIAEASATVSAAGTITAIDIVNSGRNYLPTQNVVVEVNGSTTLAEPVMAPIYFTIFEATENISGVTTMTFNEFVPYELFEDDPFTLQRISRILTSSHSFEYVGSGTSINTSLPFQGALPIKANEIVATDGAQIPFTSTDQKGNFDIGEGIQVDQTTSTVRGRDFSKAIQAEVTPLILALR